MERLNINKGAKSIQIAELAKIQDKEKVVLGNYDNDLIFRTKGSIVVQIQNKFYELPLLPTNSDTTSNSNNTVSNGSLITELSVLPIDLSPYNNSLLSVAGDLYYVYNNLLQLLNPKINLQTDLTKPLSLTDEEIVQVYQNLKLLIDNDFQLESLNTVFTYSKESSRFFKQNPDGTWSKLDSDLTSGGEIHGDLNIGTLENPNKIKVFSNSDHTGIELTNGQTTLNLYLDGDTVKFYTDGRIDFGGIHMEYGKLIVGKSIDNFNTFSTVDIGGPITATVFKGDAIEVKDITANTIVTNTINSESAITTSVSADEGLITDLTATTLAATTFTSETLNTEELTASSANITELEINTGSANNLTVTDLEITGQTNIGDKLIHNGIEITNLELGTSLSYTNGVLTITPNALVDMFSNLSPTQLTDIKTVLGI